MVQVCGGGAGEPVGGGWREMEFYPWRGAGRGLMRARLADHGKSDGGGLEVPSAVRITRGDARLEQEAGGPVQSALTALQALTAHTACPQLPTSIMPADHSPCPLSNSSFSTPKVLR